MFRCACFYVVILTLSEVERGRTPVFCLCLFLLPLDNLVESAVPLDNQVESPL
jgi:hypothetical protein